VIISLRTSNGLVFIMEAQCVCCEVQIHYMLTFLSVVLVDKTSKMWMKEKQEVSTLEGYSSWF